MKWLTRLFHEPKDPEVEAIKEDLSKETERHSKALGQINDAITDLGQEYERAEHERRGS